MILNLAIITEKNLRYLIIIYEKKITIAIDAMGGDNSPNKTIEGLSLFLKKNIQNNDFFINLYGDKNKIEHELNKFSISKKFIKNNSFKFCYFR